MHNQQKEDHCPKEQFCKSSFGFPNRTVKNEIHEIRIGFVNIIEIHPEDRFLESEIHFWVLRSIAKSEIPISTKGKSGFPNRLQPNCNCSGYLHRGNAFNPTVAYYRRVEKLFWLLILGRHKRPSDSRKRTISSTRIDLKFFCVFSKCRLLGELHSTIFHQKGSHCYLQ